MDVKVSKKKKKKLADALIERASSMLHKKNTKKTVHKIESNEYDYKWSKTSQKHEKQYSAFSSDKCCPKRNYSFIKTAGLFNLNNRIIFFSILCHFGPE